MGIKTISQFSLQNSGKLIVFEGIDGAGKSTLARALQMHFNSLSLSSIITREPGGSRLGIELRKILQERDFPIEPTAEFLLFAADRVQHFKDLILPKLKDGCIVISDRMSDSSVAYQGFGRRVSLDMINIVNNWVMHGIKPDLTIYVRIPWMIAQMRVKNRGEETVFEKEKADFMEAVINGFELIYKGRDDVIVIDGTEPLSMTTEFLIQKVSAWLQNHDVRF